MTTLPAHPSVCLKWENYAYCKRWKGSNLCLWSWMWCLITLHPRSNIHVEKKRQTTKDMLQANTSALLGYHGLEVGVSRWISDWSALVNIKFLLTKQTSLTLWQTITKVLQHLIVIFASTFCFIEGPPGSNAVVHNMCWCLLTHSVAMQHSFLSSQPKNLTWFTSHFKEQNA